MVAAEGAAPWANTTPGAAAASSMAHVAMTGARRRSRKRGIGLLPFAISLSDTGDGHGTVECRASKHRMEDAKMLDTSQAAGQIWYAIGLADEEADGNDL